MRTILSLAALLVGLTILFWAPTAKAHCPHGNSTTHEHCIVPPPPPGATLGDLECSTDQIAKFDGAQWVCDGGGAKVIFASSDDTFTGNLGGVAGADATCNTLAANAGLSGNFKAWLGTYVPLGSNPLSHFTHASVPYVLTDGTQVARDFFQLISGVLENHIDLDENGDPADGDFVWTGVEHDGRANPSNETCLSWTTGSVSEFGRFGRTGDVGSQFFPGEWTDPGHATCNVLRRIYCFEQ